MPLVRASLGHVNSAHLWPSGLHAGIGCSRSPEDPLATTINHTVSLRLNRERDAGVWME